jgi:hypothetical protein
MDMDRMKQHITGIYSGMQGPNLICHRGGTRLGTKIFEMPLHAALCHPERDYKVVEMLLENGANVNFRQADGQTPLHLAVSCDDGLTELLLEFGADIHAQAHDGSTALHTLFKLPLEKRTGILDVLLSHGANLNYRDLLGRTPVDVGISTGFPWSEESKRKLNVDAIMKRKEAEARYPRTASDIFSVFSYVTIAFNFRAPRSLILHIIDKAQYWLLESIERIEELPIESEKPVNGKDGKIEYLSSPPLPIHDASHFREIRFFIVSNDWGNEGCEVWAKGSYEWSHTYVDVEVYRDNGKRAGFVFPLLYDNVHGDRRPREYACVFGRCPPKQNRALLGSPPFEWYRKADWWRKVRRGDVWRVVGSENEFGMWFHRARIEVYVCPLIEVVYKAIWKKEQKDRVIEGSYR